MRGGWLDTLQAGSITQLLRMLGEDNSGMLSAHVSVFSGVSVLHCAFICIKCDDKSICIKDLMYL